MPKRVEVVAACVDWFDEAAAVALFWNSLTCGDNELVSTVADLYDLTTELRYKVDTVRREAPKVGRNDPCPCGSGKKFKQCHGAA